MLRKLCVAVAMVAVLFLTSCANEEKLDDMKYRTLYLVNPTADGEPLSLTEVNDRTVIFAPQWCKKTRCLGGEKADYVFLGKDDSRCHWLRLVDNYPFCTKPEAMRPKATQEEDSEIKAEDCFPHCDNAFGWKVGSYENRP